MSGGLPRGGGSSGAPRWARALLRRLSPADEADEVLGDLEEAHRARVARRGRLLAAVLTAAETVDMAQALWRERRRTRSAGARWRGRRRGLPRPPRRLSAVSWLDIKLGLRMVVKHPALSLVSGLGMAVAVAIGAVAFGLIATFTASDLPLHEGDRIVTIRMGGADHAEGGSAPFDDLRSWRGEVEALADVGAYRIVARNLVTGDGRVAPARVVEMTASGFRIARVPPLTGRYLVDDDEAPGAAPVVVIGYGLWQERFGGRADAVGETLRLGGTAHTVVGVMPRGFAFPVNDRVWIPLRHDPAGPGLRRAAGVTVFGRLAPGATLEAAQAELAVLGERAGEGPPELRERTRTRVFPYAQDTEMGQMGWLLYIAQLLITMLLMVIVVNVAVLMYARTATRRGEILVRTALGASRSRITTQLFAEALVLSSAAAALGLLVARSALGQIEGALSSSGSLPFWWDFDLSSGAVLYGFGLAVLAAVVIGVVPALGATGRRLRSGLQTVGSGGSGLKLGRTWTALIVAQVAIAVAVLPVALNITLGQWLHSDDAGSEYATGEFLWASLELDRETLPEEATGDPEGPGARYASLQDEVVRRLEADPAITHVVPMRPAPWQDPDLPIRVEGPPSSLTDRSDSSSATGALAGWSRVGTGFLEAFGVPLAAGRSFEPRDASAGENVVIVSQSFVNRVLGGGPAIGRSIRPVVATENDRWGHGTAEGTWYTIIGVVPDFPKPVGPLRPEPKVYEPLTPGSSDAVSLAVRVRGGEPTRYAPRLREIVAGVDPMLRLEDLASLEEIFGRGMSEVVLLSTGIAAVAISVLLLSVAGLYALMSFTILGRRREIGIRAALGALPHRIVGRVLSRAMGQVVVGIVLGLAFTGLVDRATGGGLLSGRAPYILPAVALLMAVVGMMAAWVPARRGLRIHPTEALRAE